MRRLHRVLMLVKCLIGSRQVKAGVRMDRRGFQLPPTGWAVHDHLGWAHDQCVWCSIGLACGSAEDYPVSVETTSAFVQLLSFSVRPLDCGNWMAFSSLWIPSQLSRVSFHEFLTFLCQFQVNPSSTLSTSTRVHNFNFHWSGSEILEPLTRSIFDDCEYPTS